jgi:alkanesulfonate monooxygenase SsuD/methylene tetrahydromethanopterin reductase-like flavin-dependent oxidoreductase (luciferase family)
MADAFANHVVVRNEQSFIVAPRPSAPPTYVGGRAPHALERALRFGHGWLPMARDPASLARDVEEFRRLAAQRGKMAGPVTVMTGVDLNDLQEARATIEAYAALGVERIVLAQRYRTLDEYRHRLDAFARLTT